MATDWSRLLDTPWFALSQLSVFSDISSFLEFSEKSIEWQKQVELQRVENEKDTIDIEEEHRHSYYEHLRENVIYRFDVALPMRVRYAALASLVATIEWSVTVLRPAFEIPKRPKEKSTAIHLLTVFAERCGMPLDDDIRRLELRFRVRSNLTSFPSKSDNSTIAAWPKRLAISSSHACNFASSANGPILPSPPWVVS